MKRTKSNNGVPQEILYSVCLAAWNLCSQNLAKFTALKAFYTEAFIDQALAAVQAAKDLPQIVQTLAYRKEARINLVNATKQVQANWQLLKLYINKAFAEDIVRARLDGAGAAFYVKASADNWSAVRSLIDTANAFIANNLGDLMANDNMPADFQTKFQADGNSCIELSVSHARLNIEKEMATNRKVEANNTIYASTIEMLKDGQQIFKDNAAAQKQFTFSYLVSIYRGERSASLKGYVVNYLGLPIEGASVVSADQKYAAITDDKGYYCITRIAEGAYTFSVTCTGYVPQMQQITFTAGTASRSNFELTNKMKQVA
jgi:hypothetical protein